MRKVGLLLALLAMSATALSIPLGPTAGATGATTEPPAYYPSGPQVGVDESMLTGWQPCWSATYEDTVALADVLTACDGDYLLLAAGPADSTAFDVLAAAPRADVLTSTTPDAVHDANGTGWYLDDQGWFGAWGFARAGDPTERRACDVLGSSRKDGPNGDQRLCWHLLPGDGLIDVGWRSGSNVDLRDTGYRRAIYESVPDAVPPTVTCTVTPAVVWPPNHKMLDVTAAVTVSDDGSGPAGFTLVAVTANEPDADAGTGDVPVDAQNWALGTADTTGSLRAERNDAGTGRVYTLTYEGSDVAGNTAQCHATVLVPHDAGGGSSASSPVKGPRGKKP